MTPLDGHPQRRKRVVAGSEDYPPSPLDDEVLSSQLGGPTSRFWLTVERDG